MICFVFVLHPQLCLCRAERHDDQNLALRFAFALLCIFSQYLLVLYTVPGLYLGGYLGGQLSGLK